jgi:peptide/nickel transport system ATP-binding protein
MTDAVLSVEGLRTHFLTKAGVIKAVDDVSFSIARGEVLGLVGESGSGKSVTGYSIMGLVDAPGRIVAGRIIYRDQDLTALESEGMRQLRGNRIAMIFQDPMMTLNPVLTIETQMVEAILAHERVPYDAAVARARACLGQVGIASPDARLAAYPHQFSGGMRQRVAIAIALLNVPDVIIADEPTTALDVTIQGQILFEMQKLTRETGAALVWITHDLSVIAGLADRVCVMYAGRIVEQGTTADVLGAPRHPYTRGLLDSVPGQAQEHKRLRNIPGMTPSLLDIGPGCAFRERCSYATAVCAQTPEMTPVGPEHTLRCFHPLPAADLFAAAAHGASR